MKKPDINEIRNLWLQKYHNTTVEEILHILPKEITSTPDWFKLYPCTDDQCHEWEVEAKKLLKTKYKIPKYLIKKGWWVLYLNCAPYVK